MKNTMLQTPEGVRDIYFAECEQKVLLENRLLDVLASYGYHPIQTPTFEFFDVFNKEAGTVSSRDQYKFFDREGNTLVLRPDMTPSIVRCAATYFTDIAMPLRFSYNANTFVNNNSNQGRMKERTQLGAEQIGDASVDADAEMIAVAVRLLLCAGLKEFQISVGHSDFLEGLFEASNVDADTQKELIDLIKNRNFYGVEEIIGKFYLNKDLQFLFGLLRDVQIDGDKIRVARHYARNYPTIDGALERLEELDLVLDYYGVKQYVSYEPALLSRMHYYTGIVFAGYTYGSGEAVVNGGRYDSLMGIFDKESPATGFALIVDRLLDALRHQDIALAAAPKETWVIYTKEQRAEAIRYAHQKRDEGGHIALKLITGRNEKETIEAFAARMEIDLVHFVSEGSF